MRDALLNRASADFVDLGAYRAFIDELLARRNARIAKRVNSERPLLQAFTMRQLPATSILACASHQRAASP